MGKFLFALPLALILANGAWAACGDTTVTVGASPFNPSSLNTLIANCDDSSMTITLKNGTGSDTVRFANEIIVDMRPNGASTVTHLLGVGVNPNTPFIVTESAASDPLLFEFKNTSGSNNRGILQNFTIVRKAVDQAMHSVNVAANGTIVRDCHFFRSDNSSTATTGSLLSVTANDVLVERCLFRSPPGGIGRTYGITTSGSAQRNEYRSNIFHSTGLYLTAGTFHIFANTFSGSRDNYNAITVSSTLTGTTAAVDKAMNIQHNLFAIKGDSLPPVYFNASNITTADSIQKNAWSQFRSGVPLVVSGPNSNAVTLTGATGGNANVVLPKGFSRYAASVTEFKEYPMATLRADENLPRGHSEFGQIPRVYNNTRTNWTTIPDVSTLSQGSKLYFSGSNPFTPFVQGKTWTAGIKVGALVDLESRETPPSPLESGTLGKGLTIIRHPSDSARMRVTKIAYDSTYYDTLNRFSTAIFFFSTNKLKLAANDSTALKNPTTGTPYMVRVSLASFDSNLTVPKEVRITEGDIFVKMLHYNSGGQATVLPGDGAISLVSGIARFPINDLTIPSLDLTSDTTRGLFVVKVGRTGTEAIDSIIVNAQRVGGGVVESRSVAAPTTVGASATVTFPQLPKGTFQFTAVPVARVGSVVQSGSPTAPSRAYNSQQVTGDTVWVVNRSSSTGCNTTTGFSDNPFCTLQAALAELATKGGGTILVKNGATPVPFQTDTIGGTDSSAVTITVPMLNGGFDPNHRPVFRGAAGKEALVITRKNVTLKGFIIEMPAGASGTALSVQASAAGASVDGCVFRPATNASASGPAVNIATGGQGDMRFINNLVWGFGAAVRINSTSDKVRILHNTFIEEAQHNSPATGILIPAATSKAVIANNYFSGIATPYDASIATKGITLDHNGYNSRTPALQGKFEVGTVDSIPRLKPLDLTSATWRDAFRTAMSEIIDCDAVKECFELYAGSSSDSWGPAITSDVLGRPRLDKPEVGALEADVSTSGVRGVLIMEAFSLPDGAEFADDRLTFKVTRRTFEPADPESVYVWWSTGPAAALSDTIPSANLRKYPISKLGGAGTFTDTAKGLDPNRTYWISAALGKNPSKTPTGRILGYAYRMQATTGMSLSRDDCSFTAENPVCPQEGYFVSPTDPRFQTTVEFDRQDSGHVLVPEFFIAPSRYYARGKVEVNLSMPVMRLSLDAGLLSQPGSKQSWKATIRMSDNPDNSFDQNDLFILPLDSGSLPIYVPTWRLVRSDTGTSLIIEGTESGTFDFGFGKLTGAPGEVAATDAEPPRFSFRSGSPETADVNVKFSGSGFATQNPLIMVTPVPAAGTYPNPMAPIGGNNYPNPTLMISSELSDLGDSLRLERFYRYYQKAVSVDSNDQLSQVAPGTRKPFQLTPLSVKAFTENTVLATPEVVLSGGGDIVEMTVPVPLSKRYAEWNGYPDGKIHKTRSIEVVFTTFDGAKISRSSGFIRTEFEGQPSDGEFKEFPTNTWNLHAYPWDEADTGSLARIFESTSWKSEYRVMKYKGSGNGPSAYTAYDGTDATGITFDAGQAVWTGSTASRYYKPSSVGGVSLDYKTFPMKLNANEWNDFGLPFNFPMKWADVLKASNLDAGNFKVWRYTGEEGGAKATWGNTLTAASVVYPWEGLTAKPSAEVTLQFPVLDTSRSTTPLAKPSSGVLWTARIRASNSTAAMSLRIGKAAAENTTSEAPDVPGQDFRVGLKRIVGEGAESLSEYIQSGDDWRGHWSLSGRAPGSGIVLDVQENTGKTPLFLVELLSRKSVPLAAGSEVALSGEELKTGDYHLVAGDSRYVEDILNGLVPMHMLELANYPNPFTTGTLIRYALPESFGKVEFRLKIRDSRGRLVWERSFRGSNSLRYQWNGIDNRGKQVGAGFYTLSLEALAPGKATQRAVRRMIKF